MEQTLGKRIVENRKRLILTQEQLAEKLGITAQAVSKWENDQSCPDITMLPKLAEIFGISTDELLGYTTRSNTVHEAEIVTEEAQENDGFHIQNGNWEIQWDNKKSYSVGFAVLVLCVGLLFLLSQKP
jgi:transcriptional regulator with XRE-family HTH domain